SVSVEGTFECWICRKKFDPPPPIPMGQIQVLLFDQNDKVVSTIHLDSGVPLNLPFASPTQTVAIASCAFVDSGHGELTWHYYLDHPVSLQPQPAMIWTGYHMAVQWVGWPEDPPLPSPQPGTSR